MLHLSHHGALAIAYGMAVIGWVIAARFFRTLWPAGEPARFEHPWREFGYSALAVAGVIGVGQLYQHGFLLPSDGSLGILCESLNQILIFSPLLVLLAVRRQGLSSAWVPRDRVWARLGAGMLLAFLAIGVFTLAREGSDPLWRVIPRVYTPSHIPHAVQVLLEDFGIAIVLARLGAACGKRPWVAVVAVAALFAGAHVPAMISGGDTSAAELGALGLDIGLGLLVLGAVQRSRDIWWVWCVHFAMDMMQFEAVGAAGA